MGSHIRAILFFVLIVFCSFNSSASDIKGYIINDTIWSGTINVIEDVMVINNKTLIISPGTVVNIKKGANIYLKDSSDLVISGNAGNKVFIKNLEGNAHWGSICAQDIGCTIDISFADIAEGQIKALSKTSLKISDSYIHEYIEAPNAIIYIENGYFIDMQRCHISNYIELNFVVTPSYITDCLFEYMRADAIDFDNAPAGSYIKNTTIRHGVGTNIDAIDFGKVDFQGLGSRGLVEACTVYDISDKGVSVGEGALGVTIKGSLFYNIGAGIAVKDASLAHIENNTFYNCDAAIEAVEKNPGLGGGRATAVNNIIWNCADAVYINSTGMVAIDSSLIQGASVYPGVANINADPLFVDSVNADFSLSGGSPAIGTGSGGKDMGAFFPLPNASVDLAYINVGAPSSNFVVQGDSVFTIAWTAGSLISQVKIEFSSDNGSSWMDIISSTDAAVGEHVWNVPNIYSSRCLIKITDVTNSSTTAQTFGNFTVLPKGTLNALSATYSVTGGFYNSSFQLALYAETGAQIYYTLDGSEPTDQSYVYSGPITIEADTFATGYPEVNITSTTEPHAPLSYIRSSPVSQTGYVPTFWKKPTGSIFKATVVKTRVYVPGKKLSNIKTHSYFVDSNMTNGRYTLPVISITTDKDNLFDFYKGIYIPGASFTGTMFTGNYELRGRASEIPVHIEMFEANGAKAFGQNIGLRIKGEFVRCLSQKSLGLFPRSEYDSQNNFDYQLFPGLKRDESALPLNRFKRLTIRNNGSDFSYMTHNTIFKDGFVQNLFSHMKLKVKAYRPSIVFINGEYWGIESLMEESDSRCLERNYGLDRNNIVIMEHNLSGFNQLVEGASGDQQHYTDIVNFVMNNDLTLDTNYDFVSQKVDLLSLTDNWISVLFACKINYDHNTLFWRYKNSGTANQNLYGSDGKWRWMTNDFDFGFYFDRVDYDLFPTVISGQAEYLFPKLLQNQAFSENFYNRFADQLNSAFRKHRINSALDVVAQQVSPNVAEHVERWGSPNSFSQFQWAINDMKSFANGRVNYIYAQMMDNFALDTMHITVDVSNAEMGTVQVNTLVIDTATLGLYTPSFPYPWTGTYFKNIPVPLKAIAKPGYKFVMWQETNDSSDLVYADTSTDITYTALFEIDSAYQKPGQVLYINEVMSSNSSVIADEYNEYEDWIEIYNASDDTIDIGGYYITDNFTSKMIPTGNDSTKIPPHGFILLWADDDSDQGVLHLNLKLSSSGDYVALYSNDRFTKIDEVAFGAINANNSYGRMFDADSVWINFAAPTPHESNLITTVNATGKNEMSFNVYPNPTNGRCTLQLNNQEKETIQVKVFNLVGEVMGASQFEVESNARVPLNFSHLPKGVYLVSINSAAISASKKIIVN